MSVLFLGVSLTPEQAAARVFSRPGACWLDGGGGGDGRWSFVGCEPKVWVRAEGPASLQAIDELRLPDIPPAYEGEPDAGDVPAWVGHVRFDGAVCFGRYDALFTFDHVTGQAFVVGDDDQACGRLAARLTRAPARLANARVERLVEPDATLHLQAIRIALDHIARGDIYQVNLARSWRADLEGDPFALFMAMREASPVPLGFYQDDGERVVCARTMERFLRWDTAHASLHSRPIKGTIARVPGAVDRLRRDPKERAEHAMIVDLVRNDLGRVAITGSVTCPQVMTVEPYRGLHHLVSTVRCRTREGVTRAEVLRATFPPGSVTGAPKIRALQIIDALEPVNRDVYTGAFGFVDRAGGLSLAVGIRTAVVREGGVRYWAGGGIVEASEPERELAETELKASVFRAALRSLMHTEPPVLSRPDVLR